MIAVVIGSVDRKVRDAKATELLGRYLLDASRTPAPPPAPAVQTPPAASAAAAPAVATDDEAQGEDLPDPDADEPAEKSGGWLKSVGLVVLGAFLAAVVGMAIQRRLLLGR